VLATHWTPSTPKHAFESFLVASVDPVELALDEPPHVAPKILVAHTTIVAVFIVTTRPPEVNRQAALGVAASRFEELPPPERRIRIRRGDLRGAAAPDSASPTCSRMMVLPGRDDPSSLLPYPPAPGDITVSKLIQLEPPPDAGGVAGEGVAPTSIRETLILTASGSQVVLGVQVHDSCTSPPLLAVTMPRRTKAKPVAEAAVPHAVQVLHRASGAEVPEQFIRWLRKYHGPALMHWMPSSRQGAIGRR